MQALDILSRLDIFCIILLFHPDDGDKSALYVQESYS